MIRASWKGSLLAALASAGVAWGQSALLPTNTVARPIGTIVTFQEKAGLGEPCRLLKCWTTDDGQTAYLLQSLDTDEMLTLVQASGTAAGTRQVPVRGIYRWGNSDTPPEGSPVPPPEGDLRLTAHTTDGPEAPPRAATPRPGPSHVAVAGCAPCPAAAAPPARACAQEPVAKGQASCCAYVHRYEKPPSLDFKSGRCLPVCPPEHAAAYGYYPTQWCRWPGGADAPASASEETPRSDGQPELLPEPKAASALRRPNGPGSALAP
jgi:hypothetical protein